MSPLYKVNYYEPESPETDTSIQFELVASYISDIPSPTTPKV